MTIVDAKNGQLVYTKYGSGSKVLIAFHGFGQDKEIFKTWETIIGHEYTTYAFDLFHHGSSHRKDLVLTKTEWSEIFSSFLESEKIERFSVLGYSLGGRFAIATSLTFSHQVNELFLIAPDGVFPTLWFKLATNPGTRLLFKYIMVQPDKLEKLIRFNEKYRLVNPYIGDFAKKELGDVTNRKRVYQSWNHFKTLGYRRNQLIKQFRKTSFERTIILGNKDHVIRPNKILPIIQKMGRFHIEILSMKHHQLVKPEVAKLLLKEK